MLHWFWEVRHLCAFMGSVIRFYTKNAIICICFTLRTALVSLKGDYKSQLPLLSTCHYLGDFLWETISLPDWPKGSLILLESTAEVEYR